MTVQIPPGFALASIEHWLDGYPRPAVTTMGLDVSGTISNDGRTLADQFHLAFTLAYDSLVDNGVTMRNARVVVGQDGGDPIVQISALAARGGQARSSTAPALALMISKNTALGGRKHRGRMYFPWAMDDNAVDERGAVNPTIVTAFRNASEDFLEGLELGNPVNENLQGAVILHSDATPPTPVVNLIPNPTIRTQRNRQTRY